MSLVISYAAAIYGIILFIFFLITRGTLRKAVLSGDERQKFLFYRASYDGLIAGLFGYIVVRGLDLIIPSSFPDCSSLYNPLYKLPNPH